MGSAYDLHRQVQIGAHAADDGQLLVVLLAKHREVRLHDAEQLGHHGGHAIEMPGPVRALTGCPTAASRVTRVALGTLRIDLVHGRA